MNRTVNTICCNISFVTDGMQNIVPASGFVRTLVHALLQLSCLKENWSISQCLFKGVSGGRIGDCVIVCAVSRDGPGPPRYQKFPVNSSKSVSQLSLSQHDLKVR